MRDLAVGRTGAIRLSALLLLVGVHTSLANPTMSLHGLLSTGSHVVAVDSATVMDYGGGLTFYHIAGWGGDTGIVDTFNFLHDPASPKSRVRRPNVSTSEISRSATAHIDPVCKMVVREGSEAGKWDYKGTTY